MRAMLLSFLFFVAAGIAPALPPAPEVHIEKIEGVILEIPPGVEHVHDTVKLLIRLTTSPEDTRKLYSTIRRKTRYRIQDFPRPKKDEVILIFPPGSIPKGAKVGDKLRVTGYGLVGSDLGRSPAHVQAYVKALELNPK